MNAVTLTRKPSTPDGTFGRWESTSGFKCVTVERSADGPHPRIQAGTYTCKLRYSHKHRTLDFGFGRGMVYGLENVQGRTDIEIHPANWAFQLLGCIAPGAAVAYIPTPDKKLVRGVTSSRAALKALMADMKGEPFLLTVKDEA